MRSSRTGGSGGKDLEEAEKEMSRDGTVQLARRPVGVRLRRDPELAQPQRPLLEMAANSWGL